MLKVVISLYVLITSAALIILKLGTKHGLPISYIDHKLHFNLNPYAITGIIMYGISFLLYTYLISKYDLGYIIPLAAAFVYVLIFLGSAIFLNEVFTAAKIVGIALILSGIIFLNVK